MREIKINKNDSAQRLDKFLSKTLVKMPNSLLQKSIRKGRVRVDGKKITDGKFILSENQTLSLYINDEFFEIEPTKSDFLLAPDRINVVYEDDNVLLLNKEAGLAVHDFDGGGVDTLINRALHYLYKKGQYDFENENSFTPALCNRIDRNTCGIVIMAKTAEALRVLNEQIKQRKIQKKYLALCHGAPEKQSGEIKLFLKKTESENRVLVSEKPLPDYKTAISVYKVLRKTAEFSLLEIELKTGRTHQIRASLAHIGSAIVGDGKYGKSYSADKARGFPYQALCSYYLKFDFEQSSPLYYLNGKSFSLSNIWFLKKL